MSKLLLFLLLPFLAINAQETEGNQAWGPGEIKVAAASESKADETALSKGQKLTAPLHITSGKGCTLLFSNGTVLVLEKNTTLDVTKFDQLGKFEVGNITAEDIITDGTHRPISGLTKEPSVSKTALTLFTGTYYAQAKVLHKDSSFTISNLLGTASLVFPAQNNKFRTGTKWRQSNVWDESKLTLKTRTDVAEGYLHYDPIKTQAPEEFKQVNLTNHESLIVTGEFKTASDFELLAINSLDITLKMNLGREIWKEGTVFFPDIPDGAHIGLVGPPMPFMSGDFGGDQGTSNIGTAPYQGPGGGSQLPSPPAPAS